MKRLFWLVLFTLAAASALAQKGPIDELGFHADKLYDFSGVDSVNLFNGNLVVSIPIGPRYSVSSNLSYQFSLVFNGKVNDTETWCEDPSNTGCTGTNIKTRVYPNLGANAGNGWRVSLGRLLPPVDTTRTNDSLDDDTWVYEGPAGDEHAVSVPNAHDGMRMQVVSSTVREIEFGSGEIHTFVLENAVWRLKQMRDRFNNAVNISYTYSLDGTRELAWTITDTVSRSHTVTLTNYPGMSDGWSRGQMVSSIALQAYNGTTATYSLAYSPTTVPILTSLTQPDNTQYFFTGALDQIRYPTGGTVSYEYLAYAFAPQDSICTIPDSDGVVKRTVSDGITAPRVWNYGHLIGFLVPVTPLSIPVCTDDGSLNGPFYWSRTSVVAPLDATQHRNRTDHYFSIFADNLQSNGFTVNNQLPGLGIQKYGHPGAVGVPLAAARAQLVVPFSSDIDARDDPADSAARLLATETYTNCDVNGDCSNDGTAQHQGKLLRSTYERYTGDVLPRPQGGHAFDDTRLVSSRTVFNDDVNCGGACYTQVTNSDDNGAMQFRTSQLDSNFPGAHTITSTTQFPQWSAADLTNRTWFLNTYTDKTRSENGASAREQFCFGDTTGALKRHRVLAGANPAANDVLHVFDTDMHGDIQFVSDFGGDVQSSLDVGTTLCTITIPTQPWYKTEHTYVTNGHYTGGVLASSRYYDRTTGQPLNFLSVDRDIDYSTGVVNAARDTAGLQTTYGYSATPARLESVTASNGALTRYTYTNASGTAGGAWTPATVQALATSGTQSMNTLYFFDGLGRNMRTSNLGPQNEWFASETSFDEAGRVAWKSAPESTGTNPPAGPLVAAHRTQYTYDPFGRPVTIMTPDAKIASFSYLGVRMSSSTATVATGTTETPVTKKEEYDHSGRLRAVTEAAGLPNEVTTSYAYDVGNHLTSVTSSAGSQNRSFTYDQRGFLLSETHPELGIDGNGSVLYRNYDAHGLAGRKTTGADNGLNDLVFSYDSTGRVTDVYDHGLAPHILKHFVFDNSPSATDFRRGKLTEATRYNHPTTGDILVTESYSYTSNLGRPSKRDTLVKLADGTILQSFTQNFTYDPFGALGQIDYPTCPNNTTCGGSPLSSVAYNRNNGFLVGVTNYAPSITYNPDGSVLAVTHATSAQITDTYSPDATGMSRPGMIKFEGFQAGNASATVSGGGNITIGQSAQIQATFAGSGPWNITWSDGQSQSGVTQNPLVRTVTPATTTNYTITHVTDSTGCSGTTGGTAAVNVASLPAPGGLIAATVTGSTLNVTISWNVVPGATWYQVERATRLDLGDWQPIGGHPPSPPINDAFTATANPVTYLYRVRSGITMGGTDYPSAPSALDYATVATTLFTNDPLVGGGVIAIMGIHIGELHHAIDAVRRAAGFTTPVWSSYGPATGPILAGDNTTARQRLDEAVTILLGHGVFYSGEVPASSGRIWAYQYQQIREGVK